MNKKGKNNFIYKSRYIIIMVIIVLFSFSSYFCVKNGLNNKQINTVYYKTNSKVDYKVYLFKNGFFNDTPYLGMNRTYVSTLINHIDINFNYNLSFSNAVDGEYTYYIKGTIAAEKLKDGNDNNSYWTKEYILTDPKTVKYNNESNLNLSTDVVIDYQKYNDLLLDFKKAYNLAFNGTFKVELIVNSQSISDKINDTISIESASEVEIPLTQQAIDLSINLKNNDKSNSVNEVTILKDPKYKILLYSGIAYGSVALILLLILIRRIIKYNKNRAKYDKTLEKILSPYDSVIVNVSELPNIDNLNVINVRDFSELMDAHSEVRMPINYYEEIKGYKSVFILANDTFAWVYTLLNEEALEKIKQSKKKRGKR